jgi:hypothetical protein
MKATFSLLLLTTIVVSTGWAAFAQEPNKTEKVHRISRPQTRFSSAEAFSTGLGAVVRWQMEIETQNYGFFVYRVNGGKRTRVGPDMTLGSASKVGGQSLFGSQYFIYDPSGDLNSFYVIGTAPTNGRTILSSPF